MIDMFPSREVALMIGGFSIHWYGLLYFTSFALAWLLLPRLQRFRDLSLTADEWSALLSRAVLGVVVGGRLGYALFYAPLYFLQHPFKLFAVWEGGMASHGGFIGVTLAILWVLKGKSRYDVLRIADVIVVPVALGLALGRIGNFINRELYGIATDVPWAIGIPGVEGLRHPTAIYSSLNNLLIALVCFLCLRRKPFIPGRVLALFLMLYGTQRFIVEFFRDQTGVASIAGLSEGQLLTVPVFIVGAWLWRRTSPPASGR